MTILRSEKFDGKKFMCDGKEYESKEEAEKKMQEYAKDGFEVSILEENGKFLVFSRRVVSEKK